MRNQRKQFALLLTIIFSLAMAGRAAAQGYGMPLTVQGLSRTTQQSAAVRAMGGVTFAATNDVSLMFANPASLTSLEGLQVSLGGMQQYQQMNQDQRYGALQNYSAFSLLTESLTDRISDPTDSTGLLSPKWTWKDSVQRPFDAIRPDWNRATTKSIPIQATVAAPLTLGGMKFIVGLGAVEYANLNWYYQNNNCFSPSVLSVMNGTIPTKPLDANPYTTEWFQYYQARSGSIYGYGGMIAASVTDHLSLGMSGMVLDGSTDDAETQVGRGRMVFYANALRLDKQGMTNYLKAGTSDYSGMEFTGSAKYSSTFIDFGCTVKPPTTITRKFQWTMTTDSVAAIHVNTPRIDSITVHSAASSSGEDKIELPWRGSIGFALRIRSNFTLGMEYEMRATQYARYIDASGSPSNPWLTSSVFHIGGEFRANEWLLLRAGMSSYNETYEPLSNPIRGDAVSYPVYSAGIGIAFEQAKLNVTYEYSDMKYVDMWSNAASINQQVTNSVMANLSYTIPWSR